MEIKKVFFGSSEYYELYFEDGRRFASGSFEHCEQIRQDFENLRFKPIQLSLF